MAGYIEPESGFFTAKLIANEQKNWMAGAALTWPCRATNWHGTREAVLFAPAYSSSTVPTRPFWSRMTGCAEGWLRNIAHFAGK